RRNPRPRPATNPRVNRLGTHPGEAGTAVRFGGVDDGDAALLPPLAVIFVGYLFLPEMSEYQNVVGGRLKLKGKALDVKEGGVKKKKKKHHREESSQIGHDELHEGGSSELPTEPYNELTEADKMGEEEGNPHPDYDHLTPAERRYMEQKQKIDMQKMAKVANKSHRDRILDFNQYLANLSEHYDIPKVGPG
ncbi:unnamed protein product, partial [Urochloa humidicola]